MRGTKCIDSEPGVDGLLENEQLSLERPTKTVESSGENQFSLKETRQHLEKI